jgi:chorismate mutase
VSERFDDLRRQIADNDGRIVAAVNERLRLVEELWRLKAELGENRIDRDRERALIGELRRSNDGPLSSDGLERLVREILELTKRELSGPG